MDGELKIKCTDVYNMTRTVGWVMRVCV
jgi:hypothetical protein